MVAPPVAVLRCFVRELDVVAVASATRALCYVDRAEPYAGAPRPDLVLLDSHLPDGSASEVLRRIRDDGALVALPVLVLTRSNEGVERHASLDQGATRFRMLPFTLSVFRETVESFLREEAPHLVLPAPRDAAVWMPEEPAVCSTPTLGAELAIETIGYGGRDREISA